MATRRLRDLTSIDLPPMLRDRLARLKQHARQPYHEVVEALVDYSDDMEPRPYERSVEPLRPPGCTPVTCGHECPASAEAKAVRDGPLTVT